MPLSTWFRSVMFPQAAPPAPRPELAPRPAVPQHLVPAPRPESTPSDIAADGLPLPGSSGEHLLQCAYGTQDRATRFYTDQVRSYLLPSMVEFVTRMELVFVATSDGRGECDASLRAGPPGFVRVLDERHLAYPEYRGNGVHASLGNITENPHVGLLMIDFVKDAIGLHVNGRAKIVDDATLRAEHPDLPEDAAPGRRPLRWVVVTVMEAYLHCRKHIPRMAKSADRRAWGTDDPARKGGDYFGARAERQNRKAAG
jgi:predicted pyridoxine 5'-phosphate oxidase superfamily flavin-nucleotide-binding protein